ncbi:MAG: Nramp family divalent metal transporter [Deltaproteobacteria bacterium]|nr:Nramp family divalent metal transporter [Deltaproteobacteria bacterium]
MKTNFWQRLGPGILLAATSIGASHLVLSPRAGALFGYQLLWLILASHFFKYPAFEFGPRYAAATGQSLLAGYAKVPGPRGWALIMFLGSTVLQGVGVLAGVVNVSGCVLFTWCGVLNTELFSVIVIAAVLALLFAGGFSWLDQLNKIMITILALATILAFIPIFPAPASFARLVIPALPIGSICLVAAIIGWMPTGIDVSIWHSFWTLEKLKLLGEKTDAIKAGSRKRQLKISLTDMRIGYGLSLLTGIMFVTMGATHLAGMGSELKGIQFAQALSSAYTVFMGRWMFHVFMLTAFFAMFSTSYTVIDGFSRSFSEALAALKPGLANEKTKRNTYRGFVIVSAVSAIVTLVLVGNPVTLVTAVALISLAVAPILYALNLYCVQKHIKDPELKPARATVVIGWLGTAFMLLALVVTIYVKLISPAG